MRKAWIGILLSACAAIPAAAQAQEHETPQQQRAREHYQRLEQRNRERWERRQNRPAAQVGHQDSGSQSPDGDGQSHRGLHRGIDREHREVHRSDPTRREHRDWHRDAGQDHRQEHREGHRDLHRDYRDEHQDVHQSDPTRREHRQFHRDAGRDHRGYHRDWDTGWRRDPRYDWYGYRNRYGDLYRMGRYSDPYGYGYRRPGIGVRLGAPFYSSRHQIRDPWRYRLPNAGPGYAWVRYYNDVLLIDTWTGQVVDVIYNFFW